MTGAARRIGTLAGVMACLSACDTSTLGAIQTLIPSPDASSSLVPSSISPSAGPTSSPSPIPSVSPTTMASPSWSPAEGFEAQLYGDITPDDGSSPDGLAVMIENAYSFSTKFKKVYLIKDGRYQATRLPSAESLYVTLFTGEREAIRFMVTLNGSHSWGEFSRLNFKPKSGHHALNWPNQRGQTIWLDGVQYTPEATPSNLPDSAQDIVPSLSFETSFFPISSPPPSEPVQSPPSTPTPTVQPSSTSSSSGGGNSGCTYVNGYYRKNGTYVHGYWRCP